MTPGATSSGIGSSGADLFKCLPTSFIILFGPQNTLEYRDKVSEGQYQTVLDEESPTFDGALTMLYLVTAARNRR